MHIYCPKCEAANHELAEICAGCAHRLQPAQPTLAQLADPQDHFPGAGQEVADPPLAQPVPSVDSSSDGEKPRDIYDAIFDGIGRVLVVLFWAAVTMGFLMSVSESSYDGATFQDLYGVICFAAAFIIPLLALISFRLGRIARHLDRRD